MLVVFVILLFSIYSLQASIISKLSNSVLSLKSTMLLDILKESYALSLSPGNKIFILQNYVN